MKKLILTSSLLFSFSAFSQSYLILNNGVTLTTDKSGFAYDFGNFILPYKVTLNGGQFFVEEEKLSTIDENGFLYNKTQKIKKTRGKGLNYVINDDGSIITIDNKGFFYKFDKEASVLKKAALFGGNYFTVNTGNKKVPLDLYTVNSSGNYFNLEVPGLNPADISVTGGTYFQTKTGTVYTVNKDGFVFNKSDVSAGVVKKAGGNFFVDSNNKIYTVSEDGFLMLPILPTNLVVTNIAKLGANYMLDLEGRLFIVDKTGALHERTISDHDLRNAKVLSF